MAEMSAAAVLALAVNHLSYDPETGVFRWIRPRAAWQKPGDVAGSENPRTGYRTVFLAGRAYAEHRLAWLMVKGHWPPADLDHINRLKADNRLVNLREATRSQNGMNGKVRKASGLKGAYPEKRWGHKWQARFGGKCLGYFNSEVEAHEAYMSAARAVFGEFARAA